MEEGLYGVWKRAFNNFKDVYLKAKAIIWP